METRITHGKLVVSDMAIRDVPEFIADGLGRCRQLPDTEKDNFTEDSRRLYGKDARARARSVCRMCEFESECLQYGKDAGLDGVYGGEWLIRGNVQVERLAKSRSMKRDPIRRELPNAA